MAMDGLVLHACQSAEGCGTVTLTVIVGCWASSVDGPPGSALAAASATNASPAGAIVRPRARAPAAVRPISPISPISTRPPIRTCTSRSGSPGSR